MRPIVKGSFYEGRETNVDWIKSESRKLEKDIETSSFKNRKVVQIDKNNGSIVNVFKNIRHAKHHATKVLNGNINQFNLSVFNNWSCLGFEWDLLDIGSKNKITTYYDNCDPTLYCIIEDGSVTKNLTLSEINESLEYRFTSPNTIRARNGKIIIKMSDYDEKIDYSVYLKREYPYTVVDLEHNTTMKYKNMTSIHRGTGLSRHNIYKLINGKGLKGLVKVNTLKIFKKYKITKEDY